MKLKFKHQKYQEDAVLSVIDCFKGQPFKDSFNYMVDPGKEKETEHYGRDKAVAAEIEGFRNSNIELTHDEVLENIKNVQKRQNLPLSKNLVSNSVSTYNIDVEMETGTGKTYCYIKTIFEMNKRYGWSKFVIVVPSIAIREGVYKSLQITSEHFLEDYGKKSKFFIYNSKQLHELNSFSTDSGINIMVINVQAFNAKGKDNRRIYMELDDFQSRKPIDVIKANRPIMIVDEPQKIGTGKSFESLKEFNPLMILRYSATHKVNHNKVHRLDALDAYNQKLVKKISVKGISVKSQTGTTSNLYLEGIDISKSAPTARLEMDIKQNNGVVRKVRRVKKGDNLFDLSGGLDEYKEYVVSEIDAVKDRVCFLNGVEIESGELHGEDSESVIRRIQIRETIKSHLEKESILFHKGIKTLSLFFIDEVAKYRLYGEDGEKLAGEYAQIFEEEYMNAINSDIILMDDEYRDYLQKHSVETIHNGYFSIDKKSKRMVDPKMTATESKKGEANDVDAYDLILKDKERLLSFEEPTRFIFSHSALREGWDNPNVFTICTLKHSDNTISRRQEVGRGLRISVDKFGDRQDDPKTVHDTNVLTVVANESYKDFVTGLQKDIAEELSGRPKKATLEYFMGKMIETENGLKEVDSDMADYIHSYLKLNEYINKDNTISSQYIEDKEKGILEPLPKAIREHTPEVFKLIDSVYQDIKLHIENGNKTKVNKLNSNFDKKEFKELWSRINRKGVYNVSFDSTQLIDNSVNALNKDLHVSPLTYIVNSGIQNKELLHEDVQDGNVFKATKSETITHNSSVHSSVKYDLIGKISEEVTLTRKTVATILSKIMGEKFELFKINPEMFISEVSRIIKEQKATMIIEHLAYDTVEDEHNVDIFTDGQLKVDFSNASEPLKKHIYDYVVTDSKIEKNFAEQLDISDEVVVYAKLPNGFHIPTPVGDYNPDWAISFEEGSVKHIYFIAETKGDLSSLQLRGTEEIKIECARKFFDRLNKNVDENKVKYDVVNTYDKLMEIVK